MNKVKQYIGLAFIGSLAAFFLVHTTAFLLQPLLSLKAKPGITTVRTVDNTPPTTSASPTPSVNKRSISVVTPNPSRTVYLIGEVADNALSVAAQITKMGQESLDPIFLVETSPGGSVLSGGQIIAAIESSPAPVYTVCNFLCASMAAMIFEYGTKRFIGDRSFVMFHPASGSAEGELDKMVSRMGSMQRYIGKMEAYVGKKASLTFEQYKARAAKEAWIDGEDAVSSGFADKIATVYLPSDSPFSGPVGAKVLYEAIFKRTKKINKTELDYQWITPVEDLEWLR